MLGELLLMLHHGADNRPPVSVIKAALSTFTLQYLRQIFRDTSSLGHRSPNFSASSILHQVQQHPSYKKAFRQPETTLSASSEPVSKLDSLPNEMQLMIMTRLGDVSSLRSLSLASQTFNRIRLQHYAIVLPAVMDNEIGGLVFEEAYWALRAAKQGFNSSNYFNKISAFLGEWAESDSGSIKPQDVSLTELIEISSLHRRVIPLVEEFCSYALTGLLNLPVASSPTTISPSEFNRIARAFYRFELYCNLYQDHPLGEDWDPRGCKGVGIRLDSYRLFESWNAWDVEGIACVRDFFCARLTDAFANIQKAATSAPLQVDICPPWEKGPEETKLPGNHIHLCDDLVTEWYDETAPAGASFLHQGTCSFCWKGEAEANVTQVVILGV